MDNYKVVIGSDTYETSLHEIISVKSDTAVDVIGNELYIDSFIITIRAAKGSRLADIEGFYLFDSSGNALASADINGGIDIPYGAPIYLYRGEIQISKMYLETIEQTSPETYQLNCVSEIGLLDKQIHKGGIYTGATLETVIADIIGGSGYSYTVNSSLSNLRIYGWLPYDTRRNNLHQLMFATGVSLLRDTSGNMIFTAMTDNTPEAIPTSRLYRGGKYTYNALASAVEVTEHTFSAPLSSTEAEVVFDNLSVSESPSHITVTFDEPIYTSSLSTSGSITIHESDINYLVLSGIGQVWAKRYVHSKKVVTETNSSATNEKVIKVTDATLVSVFNSENVAKRLAAYYFHANQIDNAIVVENEKCGRKYEFLDPFGELQNGYMVAMSTIFSSFPKGTCKFITNYVPTASGNTYTTVEILSNVGTWTVPAGVTSIRAVLIGGGLTGAYGARGKNGCDGVGGDGGDGGAGGDGGKVYETSNFTVTPGARLPVSCAHAGSGGETTFYGYSSADGSRRQNGYTCPANGITYALRGQDGIPGAKGGDAASKAGSYYKGSSGQNCGNYKGGSGGNGLTDAGHYVCSMAWGSYADVTWDVSIKGNGGGGASATNDGGSAEPVEFIVDTSAPGLFDVTGYGGDGANGGAVTAAPPPYGCGGNGGNGGGGGGAGGTGKAYYQTDWGDDVWDDNFDLKAPNGYGGSGGAGGLGAAGCVIVYYKKGD